MERGAAAAAAADSFVVAAVLAAAEEGQKEREKGVVGSHAMAGGFGSVMVVCFDSRRVQRETYFRRGSHSEASSLPASEIL